MEAVASLVSCLAHGRATALLRLVLLTRTQPLPSTPHGIWQAPASMRASGAAVGARQPAVTCMLLSGCASTIQAIATPSLLAQAARNHAAHTTARSPARAHQWCTKSPPGPTLAARNPYIRGLVAASARTYYCDHVFMARLCDQIESSDQVKHCY